MLLGRIVAGPGDRLSVRDGRYVVNGQAGRPVGPTGAYKVLTSLPAEPESAVVPDRSYFIALDNPTECLDSRTLSWVSRGQIISSRVFRLERPGFGRLLADGQ